MKALLRAYYRLGHLVRELMKFGVVGSVAFVVDIGVFNLVLHATDKPLTVQDGVHRAGDDRRLRRQPELDLPPAQQVDRPPRVRAVLPAQRGRTRSSRLSCLAISHYLLDFTSRLADNIAANVIGLGLGTAFRFWSYRRWVFPELLPEAAAPEALEEATLSEDRPPQR